MTGLWKVESALVTGFKDSAGVGQLSVALDLFLADRRTVVAASHRVGRVVLWVVGDGQGLEIRMIGGLLTSREGERKSVLSYTS